MLQPEAPRELLALVLVVRPGMAGAVFGHAEHGLLRDVARGGAEAGQRAVGGLGRHAAQTEHGGNASRGVGSAAEAEEPDPVSGAVVVDDEFVAVDDVGGDSPSGHRRQELAEPAPDRGEAGGTGVGAETGIVEHHLLFGIDVAVRPRAGGPIHLEDVAHPLFGADAAVLTRPVGVDDDVLRHATFLRVSGSISEWSRWASAPHRRAWRASGAGGPPGRARREEHRGHQRAGSPLRVRCCWTWCPPTCTP